MSNQTEMVAVVKEMFLADYLEDSPEVRVHPGDIISVHSSRVITMVTNDNKVELPCRVRLIVADTRIMSCVELVQSVSPQAYDRVAKVVEEINEKMMKDSFRHFIADRDNGTIVAMNSVFGLDKVPSVALVSAMHRSACELWFIYGEQILEAMGEDLSTHKRSNTSQAKDLLDETLKGNKDAEGLLMEVIRKNPNSDYHTRLKRAANNGNKRAQELLKQLDPPAPVVERKKNYWQIAGFVLSLLSCFYNRDRFMLAIIGLTLSAVGRSKADLAGEKTELGTAGIVLGIIGIVISCFSLLKMLGA